MKIKECQLLIYAFLITAALLSQSTVTAQTCQELADKAKTECEAKGKKDVWYKSGFLGFNLTNGNSKTLLTNVGGSADVDYSEDILHFAALYNYGRATSETTDSNGIKTSEQNTTQNNIRGDASYKHLLSDKLYLGIGANYLHDNIADIQYRVIAKPSVGYFLIKDDVMKLAIETGPGYVFQKVNEQKDDYLAPYIGDRIDWTLSKTAKLYQATDFLYDVDDSKNYLITSEAGIEAAITNGISLVTAIRDIYDNVPADGKLKNDITLITALKFAL